MGDNGKNENSGLRYGMGFLILLASILCVLSLYHYDWHDISALHVPATRVNLIGPVGAWTSYGLFILLGAGAYLVPVWLLIFGFLVLFDKHEKLWPKLLWSILLTFSMTCLIELSRDYWEVTRTKLNIPDAGGFLSRMLTHSVLVKFLNITGAGIFLWVLFGISLTLTVGFNNFALAGKGIYHLILKGIEHYRASAAEKADQRYLIDREERLIEKRRRVLEKSIRQQDAPRTRKEPSQSPEPEPEQLPEPEPEEPEEPQEKPKPPREPVARKLLRRLAGSDKEKEAEQPPAPVVIPQPSLDGFVLPGVDLLEPVPPQDSRGIKTDTTTASTILVETLAEFGIEAKVTNFEVGPVVTRYELLPAPGVRVERISGLSNNIALALKASSIRVQAPIPGKGVVGIEVPNSIANKVYLRELLEGDTWKSGKAALPLALGKDVGGNDIIADLASMPHLLIAGATGSGKTVCMNAVLAGLLMSRTPSQLKLMLVDPKIVEFSVYNELPHLVVPVITNPKKVALGLRWAINEMEKRYKLFAKVGVRNIESYNRREIATQNDLFNGEQAVPEAPKTDEPPRTVPYIVIVIDELADLMLADQAEIENCIARLAQLSRAVGIHMILATQRPSVNVITGTIKANFPSRIAFQVAQKVDSRTILDTIGADKLLGRGDMLFLPPGSSKLIRAQGALISDADVNRLSDFIKKQAKPTYETEIQSQIEKTSTVPSMDDTEDDEVINQAIEIIRETQRASTSSLQRRLRIGYTRAARVMDILEERGIVGPTRGAEPREILIDLDGGIPNNASEEKQGEQ